MAGRTVRSSGSEGGEGGPNRDFRSAGSAGSAGFAGSAGSVRSAGSRHSDDAESSRGAERGRKARGVASHVSGRTTASKRDADQPVRSTRSAGGRAEHPGISRIERSGAGQSASGRSVGGRNASGRTVGGRAKAGQSKVLRSGAARSESAQFKAVQARGGRSSQVARSSGSSRSSQSSRVSQPDRSPRFSRPAEQVEQQSSDVTVAKGRQGAFVDARRLHSEDYVAETLRQTAGTLGVAARPKVVDFTERSKERKRASARVIAVRVAVAAGVVAVVTGLVWLLFFSTVFRLESAAISVTGANEWVSEQTIHDIADKQAGKSLFLVSTRDVADQLQDIPGVSEAKVTKRFPKAMNVAVTAQRPAAMLKSGETLTAVDAEGRVLNSVSSQNVDGIPVIEVKDAQASLENRSVKEALTILGALPESMRQQITKVTAETQDSVTTTLDDGERVIVWGDSSQLKLKMAVVDKIINDPKVIGDKHQMDVSAPLKPIIK